MSDPWPALVNTHGRKAVMSLSISEAELDDETDRQVGILMPMIAKELTGDERSALDYGSGCGRFTAAFGRTVGCMAVGFDPCEEMIQQAPATSWATFMSMTENQFFEQTFLGGYRFDAILSAMVLGNPDINLNRMVAGMVSILSPKGSIFLIDHMPDESPPGRWWQFRSESYYAALFAKHGIEMRVIGHDRQLTNPVTIMCGRHRS